MKWLIQLGCFCIAAFFGSVTFVLAMVFIVTPPLDPADFVTVTLAFTVVVIMLAGVPAVGAMALTMHKGWRRWFTYVALGAGIGLLLSVTTSIPDIMRAVESRTILAGPLAGAVGGLAYWALIGRATPVPIALPRRR